MMGISYIMKLLGFEVTEASNGYQAVVAVESQDYDRVSKNSVFQCILMDLNMPVSNGYDAC
jgi:CheY-like chemotaxis protein